MKVGRNDPCPCGSGKKYKHCCYAKDSVKHEPAEPEVAEAEAGAAEENAEDQNADTDANPTLQHPHKDRSRFTGQDKGKSVSFRPKASRGAQRGS